MVLEPAKCRAGRDAGRVFIGARYPEARGIYGRSNGSGSEIADVVLHVAEREAGRGAGGRDRVDELVEPTRLAKL